MHRPLFAAFACLLAPTVAPAQGGSERPNILWITSEDNGPHLGCYGDPDADTPNLDALAKRGLRYRTCWSNAPVCAPARTAIISGLYPTSTGAEHMRSMARLPAAFEMYPQYLREAGYYCTNNSKEDYNLRKPGKVWDESSRKAHWRNRDPGQPFFAIFNITTTHESQIRKRPHEAVHDPATVEIPAYHPDAPEVRQDWAQYHDKMTQMDRQAGRRLKELADAGLAADTIVFYYGDHGPGMPRGKRWPYDSGLRVPLIVHIPEKFAHLRTDDYAAGGATDRLVSFVDLAPTALSLAGVEPPEHFQGHAFLGPHAAPPQDYVYGFRGRMDERVDMVRSVRDRRYLYIRNFHPHRIYGQHVAYMFQTPTTRVWKAMFDRGELNDAQQAFWRRKPTEELYDLHADPDEVDNLATTDEHARTLIRMRTALRDHVLTTRDVGFLPEHEIHTRSKGSTPYEMARTDAYPIERVVSTAARASSLSPRSLPALIEALGDGDAAVRYWAVLGIHMRGAEAVARGRPELVERLRDPSPSVRAAAAEALATHGQPADMTAALDVLVGAAELGESPLPVAILALNALDGLDAKALPVRDRLAALPRRHASVDRRGANYVPRLLDKILADLGER